MPSPRAARIPSRKAPVRRKRNTLGRRLDRWRKRALRVRRTLKAAPPAIRTLVVAAAVLIVFAAVNLVYQVVRKPTEMFFPVSGVLNKMPAETWQQYAPLFHAYSTAIITPELLAALAQVEGAGNPVAHTYWRWHLAADPFAIYRPASSSVGMYQMTDAAFAESRRYCIRHHSVVEDGAWNDWHACWFNGLYSRVVPAHAIELTAISLDRQVRAILWRRPTPTASLQQKQDLAAIVHLCGAGPAKAFAHRGFHLTPGESCGDQEVGLYLTRVDMMKQLFLRLAADR